MKNVLYGCGCTLLLALTWLALDARTVLHNLDAKTEQVASGTYHLTMTAQQAASHADTMFTSDDVQGLIANLTTITRHADSSLTLADGVSRSAQKSADKSVDTQQAALNLLNHTDTRLNGDDGVLVQFRTLLATVNFQATALGHDSQEAIRALTTLAANPDLARSLANIETGTKAFSDAGVKVDAILYDLQHPEKPGKFVRAVGIMLNILGATSKMGQSAPVFGR